MSGGRFEVMSVFKGKHAAVITSQPRSEAATPRMLLGLGLRMRSQEVVEHMEKVLDMQSIITRLAGADVIDNHITDFFRAMLLVR
jgi:hypothetical protein